ncbi:hypothetical protein PCK2_000346, partial [Pneumocystis canis]
QFSPEFTAAVEAKQVAQQETQKAAYLVDRARQEKQGAIVRAQGEAKSAELIGEAIKKSKGFLELRKIEAAREISRILAEAYNGIGQSLSTFYEEYANFLEKNGRVSQANEIYQLGIERAARPFDRLQRRYNEFVKRSMNNSSINGPNSPALAPTHSILSTKFLSTFNASNNIIQTNNSKKLSETPRINVYIDAENGENFKCLKTTKWDNIGTVQQRRKENSQEAKPWMGEKLLMKKQNQQFAPTEKFTGNELFKESSTQLRDFLMPKKEEKIIVNLEAIYYENGEEFSLDELKAKTMARQRLGLHRASASIIDIYEMYLYRDMGFLIMKYRDQGTILDLVNIFKAETGNGVDETLAIFFTIELLRTLEQLHNKGILHGDLKPDNCLLRFDPVESEWVSKYQKDGSGGWASKGIVIIDFGRGIDLKIFSPQVQFITDSKTDEQDCAEMREARPWTYQIDYHGLATIIHTLLFGKHIEIVPEKSLELGIGRKKYRLVNGFKRYWQQDFWKKLFDLLLNPVANAGEKEEVILSQQQDYHILFPFQLI